MAKRKQAQSRKQSASYWHKKLKYLRAIERALVRQWEQDTAQGIHYLHPLKHLPSGLVSLSKTSLDLILQLYKQNKYLFPKPYFRTRCINCNKYFKFYSGNPNRCWDCKKIKSQMKQELVLKRAKIMDNLVELEPSNPNPRDIPKPRKCLRCMKPFESSGISNRICKRCSRLS